MRNNEINFAGTEPIEQSVRIEKLKQRLCELAGANVQIACTRSCDLNSFERFLEQVVTYKQRERNQHLRHHSLAPPGLPPAERLDDLALTDHLWSEILRLARDEVYLYHTDHLTDRELYAFLRQRALVEDRSTAQEEGHFRIDLLGGFSDYETYLYLKYYAEEPEREQWLRDMPDYHMPKHREPPYDRDRHLPRPD